MFKVKGLVISFFFLFIFLVFTGCFDVTTAVTDLPNAENSVTTSDGRLFVTAVGGLYEIFQVPGFEGEFDKRVVIEDDADFLGVKVYAGKLFMVLRHSNFSCSLKTYDLRTGETRDLYTFRYVRFPNGIAFDNYGRLYINDQISLSLSLGRIVRLRIDHAHLGVLEEKIWLNRGVNLPNGMVYNGGALIISDLCKIKRIPIVGDYPGIMTTVYNRSLHFLDDLTIASGKYLCTDFLQGTVFCFDPVQKSVLWETNPGDILGPSSIVVGKNTSMFPDNAIVVTSKGILGNFDPDLGNRLVYFLME